MAENNLNSRTAYLWVNHPVDPTKRTMLTVTQTQDPATQATTTTTQATLATTQATLGTTTSGGGGGGGCLLHDELILMDNGTSKKVQDVVVGDIVKSLHINGLSNEEAAWKTWSTDESNWSASNTSTTIDMVVSEIFAQYWVLAFTAASAVKTVNITGEHPILVKTSEGNISFQQVRDIVDSDVSIFYQPANAWLVLDSKTLVNDNTIPTYNLGAESSDNYIASGIVVHNAAKGEGEGTGKEFYE